MPLMTRAARGLPAVGLLVGVMLTGLPAANSGVFNSERAPYRVATGDCGPAWVGAWQSSPVQYHAGELTPYLFTDGRPSGVTAPTGPITTLTGRTLRMTVPPVVSGTGVRLHFSNRFGNAPLRLGSVVVARHAGGAAVVPGTSRALTFEGGSPAVTIPQGEDSVSDPLTVAVVAHEMLAVSVYVIEAPETITRHLDNRRTSYVSEPGDYTDDGPPTGFSTPTLSTFHLTGVDVLAPRATAAVVAVGDSITDGAGATVDSERRYTDALQRRLDAAGGDRRMAVLNAGVGGNRLLTDEEFGLGESALRRLAEDAAVTRGAVDVILHEGTNDMALTSPLRTADDIIDGMKRFARTAHKLGLRAFATTITPSTYPMHSHPHTLATRETVNHWVRTHAAKHFDGVFDFAAAVADQQNPKALAAEYDSGDQLHLSDAGLARLADAVDITKLSGSPCLKESDRA